jgi:hypothetical protein
MRCDPGIEEVGRDLLNRPCPSREMLRLIMSSSNVDPDLDPVNNSPFSKSITWRVMNAQIVPEHSGSSTGITNSGVVDGPVSYSVPEQDTLTLSASINGCARIQDKTVTRAVIEALSPAGTYDTKAGRYAGRLLLWGLVWVAAYALSWPAVAATVIYGFVFLFAAICVSAPFFVGAIVNFFWWAGRGFANESRVKWSLAALLWVLDVGPLVFLQIRVL